MRRTPKCRKNLVRGVEKDVMEGLEESTLWDIYGPDVARVCVETSIVIAGTELARKSSTEVMVKEIACLKQSTTRINRAHKECVKR